MVWERIRGHAAQIEMFRRALARRRFSHAYLLAGPAGVGKRLFAQTLARCLLCERSSDAELEACGTCPACRRMQAGTHPDYLTAALPDGKSALPIELFVGSSERRGREGLCHDLSLRPMAGDRRIAVIDDAQLMSTESANALLKTLEEPPPYATLFLIGINPDVILPTIRSRCQLVRFAALPERDVVDLLIELGWVESADEAAAIAALCEGSLAVAAQLLDPNLRTLRESLYDQLAADPFDSVGLAKAAIGGVEALGGDSAAQRRHAVWLIRFVVEFYRAALARLSGGGTAAGIAQAERFVARLGGDPPGESERLVALIERGLDAEDQIQRMTPVPLCLEGLFDDLGHHVRRPTR